MRRTGACSAAAVSTARSIARRGRQLFAECQTLGGCETGSAKITRGYRLPAKHVIHAVGPVWNGGGEGEEELLASCYRTALDLAAAHRLASLAFPAISTGVYRFPADRAARIAVGTVAAETRGRAARHRAGGVLLFRAELPPTTTATPLPTLAWPDWSRSLHCQQSRHRIMPKMPRQFHKLPYLT